MSPKSVDLAQVKALRDAYDLHPLVATVLINRGLGNPEAAGSFLRPRLKDLSDPFSLPGMEPAISRLQVAIESRQKIVLYGDYDVDGVTSLALLKRFLARLGAKVSTFLPHRMDEGYGITPDGLERCLLEQNPDLLVAVDCGTNSADQLLSLRRHGVDSLVLDHHEIQGRVDPEGEPILVNAKRGKDWHYLCSVGVAFKVCHALRNRLRLTEIDLRQFLDLVALGTVADLVPLEGENRTFVRSGLRQMEKTLWPGLSRLIEVSDANSPCLATDLGFRLGPRLNAAGRLGTAQDALDLLLEDDGDRAKVIANRLDQQNRSRQAVERRIHEEAEAQAALLMSYDPDRSSLVLAKEDWHPGVIGIVAARIARSHHRPAIVIAFDEDGMGKGSGRSIPGISLVKALQPCQAHLERFGGHEMASGLTIHRDQLEAFRAAFEESTSELLSPDLKRPKLKLEAEAFLDDLTPRLLSHHELMQPFGNGHAQPVFLARGILLGRDPRVVGGKHLQLLLTQGSTRRQAVYFDASMDSLPRPPWDVAFTIAPNTYQGETQLQIVIKAVRTAQADPSGKSKAGS